MQYAKDAARAASEKAEQMADRAKVRAAVPADSLSAALLSDLCSCYVLRGALEIVLRPFRFNAGQCAYSAVSDRPTNLPTLEDVAPLHTLAAAFSTLFPPRVARLERPCNTEDLNF